MFESHELVYTHDSKTGQYSGGGYALKSELLTGGAPALITLSGGGRKNRRRNSGSGSGSGSGSDLDAGSGSDSDRISSRSSKTKPKVSSIITNNRSSIVIPAGLFLIHGPARNNDNVSNDNDNEDSAFTTNTKLRSFLYNSDSDSDAMSDSDSSDDERGVDRKVRKVNNVIPDDLYTALFKMLAPNESDKKRYWVGSAVTCRRRLRQNSQATTSPSHKPTRKHKK